MSRLRSQCDTIDHKNANLVDNQLEKCLKELQSAISSIFDKSINYSKLKSGARIDPEDNSKAQNLSKYLLDNYAGDRSMAEFRNQRRSSSNAQTISAAVSRENFQYMSSTPNGLKTVGMFVNDRRAGNRTPGTEAKRLKTSGIADQDRFGDNGLFSADQKAAINNLDDFQNKIFQKLKGKKPLVASKKCPHELDEDPMASINRKLAAFNLRQRSRDLNRSNYGNHADYRSSDWFSSKPEDLIEPKTDSHFNFMEGTKPNVENLRNFRQKMRERYSKEQLGGFRSKLVYCTQ